jgi:hypothetical protein
MHQIKTTLEKYGHPVTMLTETRIGYVVYEDERQSWPNRFQVALEFYGSALIRNPGNEVQCPRPTGRRVSTSPSVVICES